MRRVERERLEQIALGDFRPATFALQDGKIDPPRNQIRPQLESAAQRGFRKHVLPLLPQQIPQVDPGCGKVGSRSNGTPVARFGFLHASQPGQCESRAKFTLRQARAQRECGLVLFQCLLIPSQQCERIAQPQVRRNQRRAALERELELGDSFFRKTCRDLQLAEAEARQRIHAIEPNGALVGFRCLLMPRSGLQRLPQSDPCRDHLRRRSYSGRRHLHSSLGLAAGQRHQAHANQRRGLRRVPLQNSLVAARNLGQAA